uniref:Uncharacterized protein AlNc14C113G6445 n=1 Tax=Albugo laibachii Nc14 TaxID=890382 RepID=F0WIQ2_9STRA|nr:conserved hypothetical protein [Albugo laibachii Nc14]|eukprot:CCA21143.1 conserved hypothetical protein [Albugo laibachii Nc14]
MARGKADRQLTVGKKLKIIEEADETGLMSATAQKYGVKTGQIRDWKKNIDRLRATDPSRLVCASTIQRGHLVFNETYAQYWVGYNKYCTNNTNYDDLKSALHVNYKDIFRDGINTLSFPTTIDPTTDFALECPSCSEYYELDEVKEAYRKDLQSVREQLGGFFDGKPFPTKYLYFVTRLDFYIPDALNESRSDMDLQKHTEEPEIKMEAIDGYISVYVAICGNGSVMVPMSVFPPTESWHWERKKRVKLRHAHSVHRTKPSDPQEALQFFSVTWRKFYDEDAKYSDKFAFLLDSSLEEFRSNEFTESIQQLEGYGKYWNTFLTVRNPLRISHYEHILSTFVIEEWRNILQLKKSSQPNDYRKCVAFWFYTAWEHFAGDHARAAFRSCNMFLENKSAWSAGHETTVV